jgi:hypothetical protein
MVADNNGNSAGTYASGWLFSAFGLCGSGNYQNSDDRYRRVQGVWSNCSRAITAKNHNTIE